MSKLKKLKGRIDWMRRNKGSVKWGHATELLGWLGFKCKYVEGSHHFWVHPALGNEDNPLMLVRPHGRGKDDSMSRFDVKALVNAAEDVLEMENDT